MKHQGGMDCPDLNELSALMEGRLDAQRAAMLKPHVDHCEACQMEYRMLVEFEQAVPEGKEQVAVDEIVRGLRREPKQASGGWREWFTMPMLPKLVGGLALLVLVATVSLDSRLPKAVDFSGSDVKRSSQEIQADITVGGLAWKEIAGAVRYAVAMREVDGAELWKTETPSPEVVIPQALLPPGKTVLVDVKAMDGAGRVLAQKIEMKLRVEPGVGLVLEK